MLIKLIELLTPIEVAKSIPLTRIGNQNGEGGYIMLDDFKDVQHAYSLGIGNNVTWDKAMAEKGIHVYMYDHTIEKLPEEHEKFHWKKRGIANTDTMELSKLGSLIKENGHENDFNMILKSDIEGYEWDMLESLKLEDLARFKQISMEIHWLTDCGIREKIIKGLEKIRNTHTPIHIHTNNCFMPYYVDGIYYPYVMEVTFVRNSDYTFTGKKNFGNTEFDRRSTSYYKELNFDTWKDAKK